MLYEPIHYRLPALPLSCFFFSLRPDSCLRSWQQVFPFPFYILFVSFRKLIQSTSVVCTQKKTAGMEASISLPFCWLFLAAGPREVIYSCWTFVSFSQPRCGLKGWISQILWKYKILCLCKFRMFWREIRLLTTQCHQPLRLGDKKSPLGFAAAFGPFSNGKIHSEFQAIAFEFSLWKMTNINFFLHFVGVCHVFLVFYVKISSS